MDQFTITDERLERALRDLRRVNWWLGAHSASLKALQPLLRGGDPVRLLDVATGGADFPEYLLRYAPQVLSTGLDIHPETLQYARKRLERRVGPEASEKVRLVEGDALNLPFADNTFDVAVTSLFMHHLEEAKAVRMLGELNRVARFGFIVNDLHRHPMAYYGVMVWGLVTNASEMFWHDGPLSVLKGFTREELRWILRAAELEGASVTWRWAFRWIISTVEGRHHG